MILKNYRNIKRENYHDSEKITITQPYTLAKQTPVFHAVPPSNYNKVPLL